jgi:hypothetical protein
VFFDFCLGSHFQAVDCELTIPLDLIHWVMLRDALAVCCRCSRVALWRIDGVIARNSAASALPSVG